MSNQNFSNIKDRIISILTEEETNEIIDGVENAYSWLGIDVDNNKELLNVIDLNILFEILRWGIDDTEVRENIIKKIEKDTKSQL